MDPPFDALRYIASYADLIRAFGTNADLGRWHWETVGKGEGRNPFGFDPIAYAAVNPDVARQYGTDTVQLTLHYLSSGFAARRPTSGFDPIAYAAANPDLARAFGADTAQLLNHWVDIGVDEGRKTSGFNALGYAAANPVVAQQFGVDAKALAFHYVSEGARAGLVVGVFDPLAYGAANRDLARQFGTDRQGLTKHYIEVGAEAGLATRGFDPIGYAAVNPDLIRVFGANASSLVLHWLNRGADEGRATSGFDALAYAAVNPQLARTYGADGAALVLHYVTEGFKAGLKTSGFDAIAYGAANPDLARAFGANVAGLTRHWVDTGVDEGRATSGFNALAYAAANPQVAKALGADVPALMLHFVTTGARAGLKTSGFDAIAYAAANPDLAIAFGADVGALVNHYVTLGVNEGRKTSGFDALGYAWANPDVARAVGLDPAALALQFVTYGAKNGLKTAVFDPIAYAAANADVARAFGADTAQLKAHFIQYGLWEGRQISGFDPLAYAATNPNLLQTYGWKPSALTMHYVTKGAAAGLSPAGFDAYAYAAVNPDLARSFGANPSQLMLHWITRGIQEGRKTTGFDAIQYGAANGAVVLEVGLDATALTKHYVEKGMRAGLPTAGFDSVAYLLSSSDLGTAGLGAGAAFVHWLTNGIFEGRPGDALFGREQQSHALASGSVVSGRFDSAADRDWYAVELTAGQSYALVLSPDGSPVDGQIRVHAAPGQLLAFLNGSGISSEAALAFAAPSSGTYYVAVAASGTAGNYRLGVGPAAILDEDGAVAIAAGDLLGAGSEGLTLSSVAGTAVPQDGSGVTVQGLYGTLTVARDGSWSYSLDDDDLDTERLLNGEMGIDRFDYLTAGGNATGGTLRVFVRGAADSGVAEVPLGAPTIIGTFPRQYLMPSIADFNEDGWLEPFGFLSNGQGGFVQNQAVLGAIAAWPGRAHRDARIFDLNGDGHVDALLNVYSNPSVAASFGLILLGDGTGGFAPAIERRDINGFGETILSADFDNDGDLDAFLPVYTHAGTSPSNYLLFNENGVLGPNRAMEFGVGLPGQPAPLRVEGAQAIDVDFDGRIDLFTASHLFLNKGSHFDQIVLDPQHFDEGSKLFDYDNDGDFDLVLMDEHAGPILYEWADGRLVSRGLLGSGDFTPGVSLNVYDVDGNGWEDVVARNVPTGVALFLNFEGHFVRTDIATNFQIDGVAFFDADKDGRIDMLARANQNSFALFPNVGEPGKTLALSVLGADGQENQQGRVLTLVHPDHPDTVLARAVESGSGYMNQSQYEMLIGLPYGGSYRVEVVFADRRLAFEAGEGHTARAFAEGRVEIEGSQSADRIGGSTGDDTITGGGGADILVGGAGSDRFRFVLASDSSVARDHILDFSQGEQDRLDLSSLAGGAVPFHFVGAAAFGGNAGEVRAVADASAGTTTVSVDLDGNAAADMQILLVGAINLTPNDFLF